MSMKRVFLLLLFGLAGCAAPSITSPAPTPGATLPLPTEPLASSTPGPTPPSIAPFSTQEPAEAWKRVSDDGYKYSFEVPAAWIRDEESATPDRLMFFSDPTVVGRVGPLTLPNGLIKLDFAADPVGKGEPDLTRANPITVAGRTAWIIQEEEDEGAGPSSLSTMVYILGPEYWYTLWLGCTPPSGGDAKVTDAFIAECRQILDHILGSFQIMP